MRLHFVAAASLLTLAGCPRTAEPPKEPPSKPLTSAQADAGAPHDGGVAIQVLPPKTVPTAPPLPSKVKIVVRTTPKSFVMWGKEKLGWTPVSLERPRDSGPMDLVMRADGYLPLHTRAYTFRNDSVGGRLTKLGDKGSLFGAKREPPPEEAPPADAPAATPPPASAPPAAPPK